MWIKQLNVIAPAGPGTAGTPCRLSRAPMLHLRNDETRQRPQSAADAAPGARALLPRFGAQGCRIQAGQLRLVDVLQPVGSGELGFRQIGAEQDLHLRVAFPVLLRRGPVQLRGGLEDIGHPLQVAEHQVGPRVAHQRLPRRAEAQGVELLAALQRLQSPLGLGRGKPLAG